MLVRGCTLNRRMESLVYQLLGRWLNRLGGLLHTYAKIVYRVPHVWAKVNVAGLGADSLAR